MRSNALGERTLVGQVGPEPVTVGATFLGVVLFVVWWFLLRDRLVGDGY